MACKSCGKKTAKGTKTTQKSGGKTVTNIVIPDKKKDVVRQVIVLDDGVYTIIRNL